VGFVSGPVTSTECVSTLLLNKGPYLDTSYFVNLYKVLFWSKGEKGSLSTLVVQIEKSFYVTLSLGACAWRRSNKQIAKELIFVGLTVWTINI